MTQGINIRLSASGGAEVNATITQLSRAVSRLGTAAAGLGLAASAGLGAAFGALIKSGVSFNAELEQAVLGIAAVQKQMNPAKFKTFDSAIESAAGAVELLKEKAKTSPASFQELVQAFQSVTGAATSAGIPLQKQIDLVVLMSQALAGLGIRSEQITQEARALLMGNINEDAMAAKMLGITKQDIERAKQAGTLFDFLTGKLKAFQEAGDKPTFTKLAGNVKDALQLASAAASQQFFEIAKSAMTAFLTIDWEAIGKRAGAFVQVVIESWKEGRFGEIVGLTIEAGFEMGVEAVKRSWIELSEFLGSPRMWASVVGGLASAVNGALKLVANGFINTFESIATLSLRLMATIAEGLVVAINWAAEKIEAIANEQIRAVNVLFGKSFSLLNIGRVQVDESALGSGLQKLSDTANKAKSAVAGFFDESTKAARVMLGLQTGWTDATAETASAFQQLNDLVSAVLAKNAANAPKPLGGGDAPPAVVTGNLEANAGPDPSSFLAQWSAVLAGLQAQWGSWAQQTAQAFATVFNSAVSSISDGITGLIMGTKTWGQALMAIGNTILTTVVQSIVEMGVRWVTTQIVMATVGKSIAAASLAANAGIAGAQALIWATPATLATIASYGSAAAAAPAAIGLAQGAVIAQSLAAFKDGGWVSGPGGGRDDKVFARLSNGEFVMNAQASSRYGSVLEAMNSGRDVAQVSRAGAAPAGGGGTKVNLATFDSRRDADNWAQSQDAETWFVDMSKRTAHRWQKS